MALSVVLTCEHASATVPPGVELGVDRATLDSHVAWDPGAADVARQLAGALDAPLHQGRWTRLWVDLNRSAEVAIPTVAFGVPVPGNAAVHDRADRMAHHAAWRSAAQADIDAAVQRGQCLHLSVHSFTPVFDGARREVQVGVLFDPARPWEAGLAASMVEALSVTGLVVRANEPWLGVDDGHTTALRVRFPAERYAGIELELGQGLEPAARRAVVAAWVGWFGHLAEA